MKVGDKVVCIDDIERGYPVLAKKGDIYTIVEIWMNIKFNDLGVRLKEIKANPNSSGYFSANRFRKVEPFRNKITQELMVKVITEQIEEGIEKPIRKIEVV